MIGKTILHYKILEKLGEGGMGVVYLAEDTKLERKVAIKFLPPQISDNTEERKRFVIEAKAAAALNHPNIATIYAIEETEHETFIAMEYIAGKELKEVITNLPVKAVINYATQIAKTLQTANSNDIIHRDIKSTNIMLSNDGQIKVMDFGLAKLRGGSLVTKVGTTLGTTAYMSPEQARGNDVDQRADIWSFGVVLYEMLTDHLPFKGDYEQAVIYSMLNEEPESVKNSNSDIPDKLEKIVQKSLEKEITKRYQNASEILNDLREIETADAKQTEPVTKDEASSKKKTPIIIGVFLILITLFFSIYFFSGNNEKSTLTALSVNTPQLERLAILPFVNLKSDPETDFLGYALADQIIGALAYIKNISVRPSSAVRKYQNEMVDIATAGSDLRVDYILTGNYLKQDDLVRLNVELVNIKSNELLWRESIDVLYENAFKLQDIVSAKVIDGLKLQFTPVERERIQGDIPQNPLAYEYYLRGISMPFTTKSNQLAVEMFEKSIQLDSTFAPAYVELGNRHHRLANYKFGGMKQIQLAEQYLNKATTLNPYLLSALGQLALIYTEIAKTEEAVELTKKMLKINPNNPDAHFSLSYIYRYAGMLEEAGRECDIAISLDPKREFRSAGFVYVCLGKHEKALQAFNLDPESSFGLSWKGQLYLRQDKLDLALENLNRVIAMDPNSTSGYWAVAMRAYLEGNMEEGIKELRNIEKENPTDGEVWYNLANVYGLLGDKTSCLKCLRIAVEKGCYNYPFMLTDFFLDSVRNEPEFQAILALAKEKHETFKKKFFPEQI
jgi:serine/threonine protein kinase/Tfp pilus assembly protein PilF